MKFCNPPQGYGFCLYEQKPPTYGTHLFALANKLPQVCGLPKEIKHSSQNVKPIGKENFNKSTELKMLR